MSWIQFVWYKNWIMLVTLCLTLGVDQLSKYIVRSNFEFGESWPSEGLLRLTHVTNTGSAFGLFPNQTTLLTVASIFAIGLLIYFYRTQVSSSRWLRFAIGLQLGGAFGNLLDRLISGAVVDLIDFGWWPIFNVADSSIVVGMVLLVTVLTFSRSNLMNIPDKTGQHVDDNESSI